MARVYKVLLHLLAFSGSLSPLGFREADQESEKQQDSLLSNSDTDAPSWVSSGQVPPLLILHLLICKMEVLLAAWVGEKMKKCDLTIALGGYQTPPGTAPLLPLPRSLVQNLFD